MYVHVHICTYLHLSQSGWGLPSKVAELMPFLKPKYECNQPLHIMGASVFFKLHYMSAKNAPGYERGDP